MSSIFPLCHNKTNKNMSKDKYVQQTLTLPSEMPLFNYNINFEGLRKLLQGVNVKTNNNEEDIRKLQEQMKTKLPSQNLLQTEKKLNSSFLFGVKSQSYIDKVQAKDYKTGKKEVKDMSQLEQFCWKVNRMAEMVQFLMDRSQEHQEKIGNDNKKHQKLIDESFRRLQDKLNAGTDSFSKTINTYFAQTNDKVSDLTSQLSMFKKTTDSKLDQINATLSRKASEGTLKAALQAAENKIKKDLQTALKNDHMLRLGTVNDIKNAFSQAEKDIQLKGKAMAIKMQELSDKVNKALQINAFDIEKHKIYQKLSEQKNKTQDLIRRNNEFIEFRKNYLSNTQKMKQDMRGLGEQITKMHNKEGSFKKLQSMSDVINSLNPHLICEIGEEVKLHTVQIGKLQKMVLNLDSNKDKTNDRPMPEVGNGQNSDLIQKIIKEFMSNMDFEGRMKRSEKDIYELKKKNDAVTQLEKKIYAISKECDMGAINKELRRKCDQQNTRKDTRILDGKIQQLFEFYKQLRREVEEKKKVVSKNEPYDSATLTTKRLLSANCLSCTTSTPASRRHLTKNKMEMSLDYGLEGQRNVLYSRTSK